jgi:hypothetical protein
MRSVLAKLEIVLGAVFLLGSIVSLTQRFRCPSWASDCGGYEMAGAWIGCCLGSSLLASGLLLRGEGRRGWLGHGLIFYAVLLIVLLDYHG